jgi:hypothetical protein
LMTPKKTNIRPHDMHYTTWPPQSQRFEPTTMHYTTIDQPEKTKIRTQDHALHHHQWARKDKDSNPRPCTIHHLWQPPLTLQRRSWLLMTSCTHKPKAPVLRNDEKICHGYWWRHCTRKPKHLCMMRQFVIQPGSAWKRLKITHRNGKISISAPNSVCKSY